MKDIRGGRAVVLGINQEDQLDDHSLQQFVNSKTNRPVLFSYKAFAFEGKQVGVICVDANHPRPIYLRKDFGKLKKDAVYVRRGSSTDLSKPADPDEIATMRESVGNLQQIAELRVEFAELDRQKPIGTQLEWTAEYCDMPRRDKIPLLKDNPSVVKLPGGGQFEIPNLSTLDIHNQLNPTFYRDLAEYLFFNKFCRKVRLVITNIGKVLANDVRIEILVSPTECGVGFIDRSEVPSAPEKRGSMIAQSMMDGMKVRPLIHHAGDVDIDSNEHETKVDIECNNLQPGREVWTQEFYMFVRNSEVKKLNGRIFASNLPQPREFELTIDATITETAMTLEELRKQKV